MKLNNQIFRKYDIRGIAFQDFDEQSFGHIGYALGLYVKNKYNLKNPSCFVSGDGRLSMEKLFPYFLGGLNNAGVKVTWGGTLPTPMNFFAFHEGKFDFSVQISASHNPPEYNGLKMMGKDGSIADEDIIEILELVKTLETQEISPEHSPQTKEIFPTYKEKIRSLMDLKSSKSIVCDFGNAVPALFYPEIFESFGYQVHSIYGELDTRFPHHQPDPEDIQNLRDLQKEVVKTEAAFGFAYDGDGDRVGIVLSGGEIINADKIFYIIACDFLTRFPKELIVVDSMMSQNLVDRLEQKGAEVIMTPTGHSNIELGMKKHNSLLGGEQSGHFMFGENFYGHDDACLASLKFLSAVDKNPSLLEEITKKWTKTYECNEKIEVDEDHKFEIMEKIVRSLEKEYPKNSTIDGIRIDLGDQDWAIARASNTSPKIAFRIEAQSKNKLESERKKIMQIMNRVIKTQS